jgi:2-polyprenyl-6-methoxyphenol hydroxylase-like FAD-dependent oxidoreductase
MTAPHAVVIGGSLGGLFAANMLRHVGWRVTVFERSTDDLANRGAGIGTHDELFGVMRRIGAPVDRSIGVAVQERICLARDGSISHRVAQPQFMSAWGRIYRPLKLAFPAADYRFGVELSGIAQDASGVTAQFTDGTEVRGDLLVGADGIRSTVRAQVHPQAQPRYAGYVAWRGVLEERAISRATHAQIFERYAFCLPAGEMMLAYPVPGRDESIEVGARGYNFVWYRPTDPEVALPLLSTDAAGVNHGVAIPPPLIRTEVIGDIKATAHAVLAPQIAEIVAQTPQPFFQPIFDVESERVVFGRVALLGDAAFVARPHVGAGVTKAALDAQCLAEAIAANPTDLRAALARYEAERSHFGRGIVARARRLGAYLEAQLKPREWRTAAELVQNPEQVMREIGAPLAGIRELGISPST